MHKFLGSLLPLLGLAIAACSASGSDKPNEPKPNEPTPNEHPSPVVARADLPRDSASTVPDATLEAVVAADNAFAFDLYEKVRGDYADSNLIVSPLSVSLALSMTYAGAQNATASEMAKALRFDAPGLDVHAGQNALSQALGSRAEDALATAENDAEMVGSEAPSPDDFRLHIVNSVWGDGSYAWETPFLNTLAKSYGAGVYLADFVHQPEAERVRINDWVSDETKKKIRDLVPAGAIDDATRMVLVNAMHLKLPWASPFHANETTPGTFTKADGSTVTASFMSQQRSFRYFEDEHVQLASLPLAGEKVSLVVALPKDTLASWEASLDAASWKSAWESMSPQEVALELPKFSFTSESVSLQEAFEGLGMVQAFDPNAADFYGMCSTPPKGERLYIADIVHKAMMAIDENGVEAAAATAVIMAGDGEPPDPVSMIVDKPFVVAIVDELTGALLFLGHIHDPTAKGSP